MDGVLRLAAVPAGDASVADRVEMMASSCGLRLEVAREIEELDPVDPAEVMALRRYDPERLFLAGG